MHTRRLCSLLLGIWLGGSAFMAWVATANLESPQVVMRHPGPVFAREIKEIGEDRLRGLLRYQAAELNRSYFSTWELAQFPLALALVLILLFSTNADPLVMALIGLMAVIVALQHFAITPRLIEVSRGLDFPGADAEAANLRRVFRAYHGFYSGLEVVKWVAGLGLAVRLLFSWGSRSRRSVRQKFHMVDDPDHGHLDR